MQSSAAANVTQIGRKDNQGQESIIEMDKLRQKLPDLILLYGSHHKAKELYSEAVKGTAESSGLLSSTVQKIVKAKATLKWEEAKRNATQLSLAFEEIGE